MTYANVKEQVVQLNAEAIGLDKCSSFSKVNFASLDKLVALRNDIGHGNIIKAPGEKETDELISYTKQLMTSYADVIEEWIMIQQPLFVPESNS